jgi:hypothetical protein
VQSVIDFVTVEVPCFHTIGRPDEGCQYQLVNIPGRFSAVNAQSDTGVTMRPDVVTQYTRKHFAVVR